MQRPQSVTHVDKVKRIQADLLFPQGKCVNPFPECTTPSCRFVVESHVRGKGEKYYIKVASLSQKAFRSISILSICIYSKLIILEASLARSYQNTVTQNEEGFIRRQVSSEGSLVSLDNQAKGSSILRQKFSRSQNISPTFYVGTDDRHLLKRNSNLITIYDETDKMRGNSLRNSGRPANSMEQDSFDSFDDLEDMLVVSTTNSLNLNNPRYKRNT